MVNTKDHILLNLLFKYCQVIFNVKNIENFSFHQNVNFLAPVE